MNLIPVTTVERLAAREKVLCRIDNDTQELPLLEADDFCQGMLHGPAG